MKRTLVFDDGSSRKFWNVVTEGKTLTVTFGRLGTAGQTQAKKLSSDAACAKEAESLVVSKLKKGYVDAKGAASKAAPKKSDAKKPDAKAKSAAVPKKKLSAPDAKALLRAIELGLVPKVKAAIAKGDVDVVVALKYGRKTTPLLDAAHRANAEIVGLLIDAGAKLTDRDEYGQPVLHQVRHVAVAKRLLDAGADVNERDKRKRTALHHACELGDPDLVALFLERGADVEPKDEEGKTPYLAGSNLAARALLKKYGAKGLEKTDGHALKPKKRKTAPTEVDVDGGAIAVDDQGNVWIGGNDGLHCWDGKQVTTYEFEESFSVDTIAAGPKGTVYFSTNWGLLTFSGGAWRLYTTEDSELHDAHITEMFVDRLGRAHVMGYGSEVKVDRPISVFDGKGFTVLTAGNEFPAGLETNCLAFDSKNRMLLGTETGVVFPDGKRWKDPNGSGNLAAINVLTTSGDVVFAGAWRGVTRIGEGGKSTFTKTPDGVKCLSVDGETLWVGMSYGGLLRLSADGTTKIFKPEDSGLAEEDVEGLALGKDGTLWIAAGGAVFHCKDGMIGAIGAKATAPSGPAKPEPPKEAPKPQKKRKLRPLPTKPFVPIAKIPKHVVDAIRSTKVAGIPEEALLAFVRPSIGFELGKPLDAPVGSTKAGGRADLEGKWPTFEGESDRFLPLLFQVNLADVTAHDLEGLLPKKGLLSIFCDTSPDEIADSRVVFAEDPKKTKRLEWPEDLVDRKGEDDFVAQLPELAMSFYSTWTLPSVEYLGAFADLSEAEEDALRKLDEALHAKDPKGSSTSRLLGWPDNLQGEIVGSADVIVLVQLDASMKGPKAFQQAFSYWGNGLVQVLIKRSDLDAKKFGAAGAELAYT